MDEIIQKLKEYYAQNPVIFEKLHEFSLDAQDREMDVNGDTSGLESFENNYKKVVQKIAADLNAATQLRFRAADFAFDLEDEEGEGIKVVYENGDLDLYSL
jgi:hypothetical protein